MSRRPSKKMGNRFAAFEFTVEDEKIERESAAMLARFKKNPKICRRTPSPVNKYHFLQCFASKNEISNRPIDLDDEVANGSRTKQKEIRNGPIELDDEVTEHKFLQSRRTHKKTNTDGPIDVDAEEGQEIKAAQKGSRHEFGDINASITGHQCTFRAYCPVNMRQEEVSDLDTALQSFSSNYKVFNPPSYCSIKMAAHEQVGMISDNDGRIKVSSSSAFSSSHVECEDSPEEQLSVHCSDEHEIETENVEVVIVPDFMLYRGVYYKDCRLTFSKTSLKFEDLTVNGTKRKLSCVWTVGDIISIDAKWYERVEMAIINLVLRSKSSKRAGNVDETSAIDLLKFEFSDPCWPRSQEAIKSLSVRYKDTWNTISDKTKENAFMRQNSSFHEHFKEVIYPKGDPDAVSIRQRDVERLQPEVFINDTIIDFYIKYLKNKIQPEEQHRFHFFNSFFFRKLADLDKGLSSACQARAAFQRVHKWTRKVDIFEKDYIFVPVNYSFHWSLIVVCHPGEVANIKDEETQTELRVPCILHMDSIRGSHRGLKNLFRSYLSEEWKERHSDAADDIPSKFLHLQFVPLELPQQENSFDCGLFLLHYLELFLLQAPMNFSPFKITRSSNFLNTNWFPPAEASLKRPRIQKLIYEILEEQSCSSISADSIYKYPSSLLPGRSEQETRLQFIEQIGASEITCHGLSSNSNVKEASSNFALSAATLPTVLHGCKDSGLEIYEHYEVGIFGELLAQGNYQQINALSQRNAMSPIEEIEETSEETAADWASDLDGQQIAGRGTETGLFMPYGSNDVRALRDQQMPLHLEDSAYDKCLECHDLSEMGLRVEDDQNLPATEESSPDKPKSSSANEGGGYSDCMVEDSQESSGGNGMDDVEIISSPYSFHPN